MGCLEAPFVKKAGEVFRFDFRHPYSESNSKRKNPEVDLPKDFFSHGDLHRCLRALRVYFWEMAWMRKGKGLLCAGNTHPRDR
ncbi:unnamed protein product [Phytomonas sp. Hart1]|nr:unnamed protein product [Phytomonas sp. Hart1]|eukprot:CCW69652.1 unnamed protein product [Phytomonas sp. isolate Hart1]